MRKLPRRHGESDGQRKSLNVMCGPNDILDQNSSETMSEEMSLDDRISKLAAIQLQFTTEATRIREVMC